MALSILLQQLMFSGFLLHTQAGGGGFHVPFTQLAERTFV